jgi:predicted HD phosphohydrolase
VIEYVRCRKSDWNRRENMSQVLTPRTVSFTSIKDVTAEDCAITHAGEVEFARALPERVLGHLKLLEGVYYGLQVDRLQHSLQTATLAYKGGEDEEYVVCALLHDIGDTLASYNHPDVAAAVLKPFVSDENLWMVEKHAIFQGYYFFHHLGLDRNMRDKFRDHPCFEKTAEFCARYDGPAFNPALDYMPLDAFVPMVNRVLEKPKERILRP